MSDYLTREAITDAIQELRPLVESLKERTELPLGFWRAPYVVGFFYLSIILHAKVATQFRITGVDLGDAVADVFGALSEMDGGEMAGLAGDLLLTSDPDFVRGSDDASAIVAYQFGRLKDESNQPLVLAARELAGPSPIRSQILTMMFEVSIYRELGYLCPQKIPRTKSH